MPDQQIPVSTGVNKLLKDMGDGTYAEAVYVANPGGSSFSLVQSEDLGAGTKYILKSNGNAWQMIRKTYTDTSSLMRYASATNNATITLESAWANRTTLTYGTATEAGI